MACTVTFGNRSYTQEEINVILDNMVSQALNRKIVQSTGVSNGPLEKVASKLADKFGVPYEFVESTDPWKARIDRDLGKVQINTLRATPDSPIHEYAHLFNAVIRKEEPELWKKMVDEIPATLLTKLGKTYPDHNKDQLIDEAVAQMLGVYGSEVRDNKKRSVIRQFWNWIKDLIREMFGYPVKIQPTSTLREVAEMLVGDGPVEFATNLEKKFGRRGNIDPRRLDTVERQIGLYNQRMGANLVELYQTSSGNWKVRARSVLFSGSISDLTNLLETPFVYQLDAEALNAYSHQLNLPGITEAQKKSAEKIMRSQMKIKLDDSEESYIWDGRVKLKRVSNVLQDDPFYSFKGDSSQYENNRIWGDLIDTVLQRVILGDDLESVKLKVSQHPSADMIADEVVGKLYNEFRSIRQQFPDSILMTQIIAYNLEKGVAGSVDLLILQPDSTFKLRDLKSSVNPFTKSYPSQDGRYTNRYDKRFKTGDTEYASRKDKHRAQLSLYGYMIRSLGIPMDVEDGLGIIPVHITDEDGRTIYDVEFETRNIPVLLNNEYRDYEGEDIEAVEQEFTTLLKRMRKLLGQRILEAKKEGKNPYFIEQLVALITDTDALQAINAFVEDAHEVFFGNEQTGFSGYVKIFNDILRKGKDAEDKLEQINKLNHIRQIVDIYNSDEIMRQLKVIMSENPQFQDSSPLQKISRVIDNLDVMKKKYEDAVPDFIAEIIADYVNPQAVAAAKQRVADFEKKLQALEAQGQSKSRDRRIKVLKRSIEEQKEKYYMDESGEVDVKQMIKNEITVGGYKDIGIIDRMFTPSVSIDNSFLPNFALMLKDAFETVRRGTIDLVRDARKSFQEFRKASGRNIDNPATFNHGLYVERETYTMQRDEEGNRIYKNKKVLSLVAPVDYERFESEMRNMYERTEKIEDTKERTRAKSEWFAQNTEPRPEQDEVINGVVVTEGATTIKDRARKQMSKRQYQRWLADNTKTLSDGSTVYTKELSRPRRSKYVSQDFEKMLSDSAQRKYYFYLLDLYRKAQNRLPRRYEESDTFILPFIKKSYADRFLEGQLLSSAKIAAKRAVQRLDEDFQEEQYQSDIKTVPILFWNTSHVMDAADITRDLMFSLVKFDVASRRYEQQNKHAVLADNLLNLVKKTKPIETDRLGFRMLDKAAKLVGIEDGIEKYKKKHGSNNIATLLEAFIDTQIYGRARLDPKVNLPLIGETDLGKVADTITSFASKTQIAVNPFVGVANALQANAQNIIEGFGNEVFGAKEWAAAEAEYTKNMGSFLSDSLSPYNKSLIGQLVDLYEPMQGEYYNEYGKRLTQSELKQKFSWSTAYFMMHAGEHHAQVTAMIAMMKKRKVTRVVEGVSKEISLYDAYELDKDDKIKLKKGVQLDTIVDRHAQNSLHATNKRLHGIYNDFDAVDAQRYAAGRLILMYRKFLIPGWKKRFKKPGLDWELGGYTEGTYRTFYHKIFWETRELFKYLSGNESTLTDYEKANIRRAIAEHLIVLSTGIIVMILSKMISGMDDDEKNKYGYALYFAMRLNAEMSIYGAPGDPTAQLFPSFGEMWAIHRSPTIAFTVIQKGMNLYYQLAKDAGHILTGEDLDRYKRDAGMFRKGDSKLYAAFVKLLGVNGKLHDPESAINALVIAKGAQR